MRVLIVDDQADIRALISTILRFEGHETVEAESGRRALQTLAEGPVPDVIVLDVQMPEMDGWDTLTAIRGDASTKSVPVIMCTVKAKPVDLVQGWELGCDGYIAKPFDMATLVDVVAAVATRSAGEREHIRREMLERLAQEIA
jgi:DNA-binding response OmpR family regulator